MLRRDFLIRDMRHSGLLLRVAAMLCTLTALESIASAGILGHWQFEQDFSDSSGNGHHATGIGPHSFSTDHSSLAAGDYSLVNPLFASVEVTGFTGPANDFTIELFFKTSFAATPYQFLVSTLHHGFGTGGWILGLTAAGQLYFHTEAQNPNPYSSIQTPGSFADGRWHHVAATLSNTNFVQLYVDGVLAASGQGQLPSSDRLHLRFGEAHLPVGNFPFQGSLDEIRFSSGVLTPDQFVKVQPVPEPASLTLFGLGAVGFAVRWGRRGMLRSRPDMRGGLEN